MHGQAAASHRPSGPFGFAARVAALAILFAIGCGGVSGKDGNDAEPILPNAPVAADGRAGEGGAEDLLDVSVPPPTDLGSEVGIPPVTDVGPEDGGLPLVDVGLEDGGLPLVDIGGDAIAETAQQPEVTVPDGLEEPADAVADGGLGAPDLAICQPACQGKECGGDGCGGVCGTCGGATVCSNGTCVATCTPSCGGAECGGDGCGGVCGTCGGSELCQDGQCVPPQSCEFGWDCGMKRRCVKSPDAPTNFFAIDTDCIPGSNAHWLIGNQAEVTGGVSCMPGTSNSQSYPITSPMVGSPTTGLSINPVATGWEYELKLDHVTNGVACGAPNAFHWFALLEHKEHGGVLPPMQSMHSSSKVWYDTFVPAGASRLMLGAEFIYTGTDGLTKNWILEVNLASKNWGDGHPWNEVVAYSPNHAGSSPYLTLNGAAFGLAYSPGHVTVSWATLMQWAMDNGFFLPVMPGTTPTTKGWYIAVETVGQAVAHLKVSDVWFTSVPPDDPPVDPPDCDAIPEGMFIVGTTIYYSNGSAYCSYATWADYLAAGGPADTSKLPSYNTIPTCMTYDGTCVVN